MPLVSAVGRRSPRVRMLFCAMYILLAVGAVTMTYPFLLMLSTATTGAADYSEFAVIPTYWNDDAALFKKYLVDAAKIEDLSTWFGRDDWFIARDIRPGQLASVLDMPQARRQAIARDMREFIRGSCPDELRVAAWTQDKDSPYSIEPEFYEWLQNKYRSIGAVNRAYPDNAAQWDELGVPPEPMQRRPDNSLRMRDYVEFIRTRPSRRVGLYNADTDVFQFLRTVNVPRQLAGSVSSITYDDVVSGKLGDGLKRQFLTTRASMRYIRVNAAEAAREWRKFLTQNNLSAGVPLSERIPLDEKVGGLWGRFVQTSCPLQAISVVRPEDSYRPFLKLRYKNIDELNKSYGSRYAGFGDVRIPYAVFYADNFLARKTAIKRTYLGHNFATVFSFMAVHGKSLWVTLVFITLTILTTLTVNPLAAYAMSRFRIRESYHILVFLLATMAFPGEVLMIPSFLMIKSFPILQIVSVAVCLLAFAVLQAKLPTRQPILRATMALIIVIGLAGWAVPNAANALGIKSSANLMNTFWALILPAAASGFGIFLLKGFFDSLPPELYEAGLIDGASELRMFVKITLPLCKPILAVLALGAFTSAYGAFMHAFLVCQDPKMWTLMVFLYEFQQNHGVPMAMASLVIAAIPTLAVFVFCQNIILRGIVIPTYK